MTSYKGRTGPNFAQFLTNLNTIQPGYEQEMLSADDLSLDQELAMFTNTDFTDFDALGGLSADNHINFDISEEPRQSVEHPSDIKYEDLLSTEPNPFISTYAAPIQPAPQSGSFPPPPSVVSQSGSSASPRSSVPKTGTKRKQDVVQESLEEQTRVAAEEDKRRRNTAASARFRVKKKQREQALEKTVKEISDKNDTLQAKLDRLEMENKWLKNLITEKNGHQTEKEIAELFQKFRRESEERESKGTAHKKGVGTQ